MAVPVVALAAVVAVAAFVVAGRIGVGRAGPGVHRAAALHTSTVPAPQAAPGPMPVPLPSDPASVASAAVAAVPVYPWPGGGTPGMTLPNPDSLGAPLVFLATATEGAWVQVELPTRPNGATGWVPASDVTISQVPYRIVVALGARLLTLYRAGAPVLQSAIAPGAPSSPTPTGSFYVTEVLKLTDAGSAYGPYALGLSAFSDTYYSFDGGPGQIAIHGTNQPWLIGSYASHGCVRLPNQAITTIAQQVPAGTPVDIEP